MAKAMTAGRPIRACSDMTFHVLEIMEGLIESGRSGREIEIESRFAKKAGMAHGLMHGILDD